MKLKIEKKKLFFQNFNVSLNFFFKLYFFFSSALLLLLVVLVLNTGFWERNKNLIIARAELNGVINYLYLPEILVHKFKSIFIKQNDIYININQKNIYKLEQNRKEVLDYINLNNYSSRDHKTFYEVNASISREDSELKAKIRLKGDRKIHFENPNKSSYKLDLRDDYFFNNMNKFSLQIPRIRNYVHEWIYHKLLKDGDLVTINYDFFNLFINGEYKGYYALEEGFGKTLLERNKRRNGPIFSLFEEVKDNMSKFEVYNEKFWTKEENLDVTQKAVQNINSLLSGKVSPNDILDVKKWAWFLAITDLTYTFHGALLKSVKFYYNPINEKIEPIGYDGHRLLPNYSKNILKYKPFLNQTIYDLSKTQKSHYWLNNILYPKGELNYELYLEYIKAIEKISSNGFLEKFFDKNKKNLNRISSGIYSDSYIYDYDHSRKSGVGIYYYKKSEIFNRASFLKNKSIINEARIFSEFSEDKIEINLFDDKIYLIKPIKLNCNFGNIDGFENVVYRKHKIEISNINKKYFYDCNELIFQNKINKNIKTVKINKYNSFDDKNNFFKIKNFNKYFNISDDKFLSFEGSSLNVDENIFIPKGYQVKIYPGQSLNLSNNAFIFSRSPWKVIGTKKKTIEIKGQKENFGGGLIITDVEQTSEFKYVYFENLRGLKKSSYDKNKKQYFGTINYIDNNDDVQFKEKKVNLNYDQINNGNIIHGSVNFNNTSVVLENIYISNINSEDAINIFNSNFNLNRIYFSNNSSDAIDFDFSNGELNNTFFERIGNDAIDFSGSNAIVKNAELNTIGDKLISVGENSSIKISNIIAKNSFLGIASKDGSVVEVENIRFENIEIPFAAYNKKSEYGFPELNIFNEKEENFNKSIKDKTSVLKLNANNFGKVIKDIYPLIYNRENDIILQN